jgi:hypothetical protein
VTTGSGPSSIVSATASALRRVSGRRVQFGPSSDERGHKPIVTTTTWLTKMPASHHGQAMGVSAQPASIAACHAMVALNIGGLPVRGQRRPGAVFAAARGSGGFG